jgi:hypothetical protein
MLAAYASHSSLQARSVAAAAVVVVAWLCCWCAGQLVPHLVLDTAASVCTPSIQCRICVLTFSHMSNI